MGALSIRHLLVELPDLLCCRLALAVALPSIGPGSQRNHRTPRCFATLSANPTILSGRIGVVHVCLHGRRGKYSTAHHEEKPVDNAIIQLRREEILAAGDDSTARRARLHGVVDRAAADRVPCDASLFQEQVLHGRGNLHPRSAISFGADGAEHFLVATIIREENDNGEEAAGKERRSGTSASWFITK